MNTLTRPINEDFMALVKDTERWLDSAKFKKGAILENGGKTAWYRIAARFIEDPRQYVKAIQVYGRGGGYAIHNSLEVVWLQEPSRVDTLSWNLSGGCMIMSPDLPKPLAQTHVEQVDNELRSQIYMSLSGSLGKVVQLTAPYIAPHTNDVQPQ